MTFFEHSLNDWVTIANSSDNEKGLENRYGKIRFEPYDIADP